MPYIASIKNQNYTITTQPQGAQTAVTLDGVSHILDWQRIAKLATDEKGKQPEGGHYSLLIAGKSYEVFVRRVVQEEEKSSQTYEIQLAGQYFLVTVEDERTRLLEGMARAGAQSSAARIQAPMPGLVVNTLVQPGDTVNAGQTVIVLEAMKMENDLPSPITGTVKELKVNKGQTVDQGQLLVIIEAEQPA
ncbi:acetyl-CoA carboxylase biotin carboxyl carrier protein subunit [Dictyobacter kobayashii]|uniref:Lipoyl-binding domain-containing protein n=1 Tax=Dictyobacter kobayashii TaxID=2014872 RepID=A0A402AK66_9CHLR|nr:acetyl-CoA carboxylase biotin carboxyl carrier protein subunit [Dictyobacter kobayashii]GCE19502.1 hypothetical protein KDK_33020 [Dictyobacter kobayashii]